MSVVVIRSLFCDGPGRPEYGGSCPHWFEQTDAPLAEIRRRARYHGWKVAQSGGKDLCPECAQVGQDAAGGEGRE